MYDKCLWRSPWGYSYLLPFGQKLPKYKARQITCSLHIKKLGLEIMYAQMWPSSRVRFHSSQKTNAKDETIPLQHKQETE